MTHDVPITDQDYRAFLEAKVRLATADGFEVDPAAINPALKPHIRVIVPWMLAGGRRALFARFGMQKTTAHLECMRLVQAKAKAPTLIALPLGARLSFFHDAQAYFTGAHAVKLAFIRSDAEIDPGAINLTNFESIREGKVDPRRFGGASIDEGDILRGFGGTKTFREFMRVFEAVQYRFVATATPDPNDYIELLAYAAFLGIMDVGEAKTRFFKRDSEKADKLTIHPHKEREFWLWVASWALFLQKPSDLGPDFSDDGYVLPELDIRWHEIPSDHRKAEAERDGQGRMFANAAASLSDAAREKRDSLAGRIAKVMLIIGEPLPQGSIDADEGTGQRPEQGVLRGQSGGREVPQPKLVSPEQAPARSGEEEGLYGRVQQDTPAGAVAGREGEAQPGAQRTLCDGPGLSRDDQGPAPRVEQARSVETAEDTSQADLRDECFGIPGNADIAGRRLRDLRVAGRPEAEREVAKSRGRSLSQDEEGPRDPLSSMQFRDRPVPGRSEVAGEGSTLSRQQWVIWCDLNDEQNAIERALAGAGISCSSVRGAVDLEERERLLFDWWERRSDALVSKPSMLGSGLNLQQTNRAIFAGIGFKFKDFIQACHRVQRYGQKSRVRLDLIYTEAERGVRKALEDKWRRYEEQAARMGAVIREYGLAHAAIANALQRSIGITRAEASGETWRLVNNDCVEETRAMAADSVGLIVTSIPFATQYEYTPSYNDFGHTDDNAHFWAQMDYLAPELLRVLQPGRNLCVHVKDRIVPGGMTGLGFQTVAPFHAEAIAHYTRHGFAYLGMVTITTDVVRENNQTYRLGWSEQCKDGTRQGFGMPEYLLKFRKPPTDRSNGYADHPVEKPKPLCDDSGAAAPFDKKTNWKHPVPGTGYSRARWQMDANGYWRSGGDRLLSSAELAALTHADIYKLWRDRSLAAIYDFEGHVAVAEDMDHMQRLPSTFALLPPHSGHPEVWSDVTRMRTLNGAQYAQGRELHLCPLQFDIVDRAILQLSEPGETVLDPFSGLGTVALRAVKLRRRGLGVELNPRYHADAVAYLEAAEREMAIPTLFGLMAGEDAALSESGAEALEDRTNVRAADDEKAGTVRFRG